MKSSKPYQYIKGWVEFYKLKFKVTPDVLIPRPESELLVDEILNFLKTNNYKLITILDLGTGTGNIAISIAKNTKNIKIIATDISSTALNIAKTNAKLHGVEKRIKFIQSDLLENPSIHHTLYNILIIVTNLPYIPSNRIPYLDPSVKDFEPHIALDGGEDGFSLYRKLFQQIQKLKIQKLSQKSRGVYLSHPRGVIRSHRSNIKLIVGEIDYTHGELALQEAQKYFPDAQIEIKTDLSKKQRILKISF